MICRRKIVVLCVLKLCMIMSAVAVLNCNESTAPTNHVSTKRLIKISGDGQVARTFDSLPQRMVVELRDTADKPVVNQPILYKLTAGWGEVFAKLSATGEVALPLEVIMSTDFRGRTAANFRAFPDSLNDTANVRVSPMTDSSLSVQFTIYRTQ